MTPDQALLQLRDIHMPLAENSIDALPGWLFPTLAAVAVIIVWTWRKRHRSMNWRRQARAELTAIIQASQQGEVEHGWQKLSVLLRQIALLHSTQESRASCTGEQWLGVLDQLFDTDAFTGPDGRALLRGPYQQAVESTRQQTGSALQRLAELVRDGLPTLNSSGSTS